MYFFALINRILGRCGFVQIVLTFSYTEVNGQFLSVLFITNENTDIIISAAVTVNRKSWLTAVQTPTVSFGFYFPDFIFFFFYVLQIRICLL